MICGAATAVGRRIGERLLDEGGEVRLFSVGDVTALRQRGAFVAAGTWDDEGRLEAALTDAHTLVFVPHGLSGPAERIAAAAQVAAMAATNAGIKRVIMLSSLGACRSSEPYRAALAAAEQQLSGVPAPTLVLRSNLVASPRLVDALLTANLDGLDDVPVAPVAIDELAELVVAFDQARADSTDGVLTVRCDGPQNVTFGAYRDRLIQQHSRVGRQVPSREQQEALSTFVADGFHDAVADVDGFALARLRP